MGISKFDNFEELLPTDNLNKTTQWRCGTTAEYGMAFNFKVTSYSIQSAVSNVIRTIIHIPKCSSVLVDNLRECSRSSWKQVAHRPSR
jgi:hypothetical protein